LLAWGRVLKAREHNTENQARGKEKPKKEASLGNITRNQDRRMCFSRPENERLKIIVKRAYGLGKDF